MRRGVEGHGFSRAERGTHDGLRADEAQLPQGRLRLRSKLVPKKQA